jgi:hypothetical protein
MTIEQIKKNREQFYRELRPAIHGLAYTKKPDGTSSGYEYDETKGAIVDATCELIEYLLMVAETGRGTPLEAFGE